MSSIESYANDAEGSTTSRFVQLAAAILRHRTVVAWLAAAVTSVFAAFVCTTIRVCDSFLNVTHLQMLVCGLLAIAATDTLLAFRVRSGKWHILSWVSVVVVLLSCIALT